MNLLLIDIFMHSLALRSRLELINNRDEEFDASESNGDVLEFLIH